MTELKTPLYETHVKYHGKIVPFAGYLLPVQYESGVIAEHMAVREKAGLFDVSHMGEAIISGKDALANIQNLVSNDCESMVDGQVKYSPMCNGEGGVVDDLLIYKMNDTTYFLVINAANKDKDVSWINEHLFGEATCRDVSSLYAQIALQGPNSEEILKKLSVESDIPKKYYTFTEQATVAGFPCILSFTGYTGENGYEIYCSPKDAPDLWEKLIEAGKDYGLIPCGLGARDTLRLEASMPLYGHEMDDEITPLETGLATFVKMGKESFIGKKALEQKGTPKRTRIGIRITGRGIAREHCDVFLHDNKIGVTTSGTFLPFLGQAAAMALVETGKVNVGDKLELDVRGRRIEAEVVPLPFYKKKK